MPPGKPRFDPRANQRGPAIRINHRIRIPEVRVIGADGTMLGVMATQEAIRLAQQQGLDLVEVNPKAEPPVCKILDFGKFKYEAAKQARDAKRKQTVVDIKEIKLRPKTDDHDLAFKVRAARRFLEAGNKVKFTVRFRGREITHPEVAQAQLIFVMKELEDITNIEVRPTMDGRNMMLLVAPKPQIMQKVAQLKAQREKDRAQAQKEGREYIEPVDSGDVEGLDDDDDDDEDDDDEDDAPAAAKSNGATPAAAPSNGSVAAATPAVQPAAAPPPAAATSGQSAAAPVAAAASASASAAQKSGGAAKRR